MVSTWLVPLSSAPSPSQTRSCKIYLSTLQNAFVKIANCISDQLKNNIERLASLSSAPPLTILQPAVENVFFQIKKMYLPELKMYLSESQNVFAISWQMVSTWLASLSSAASASHSRSRSSQRFLSRFLSGEGFLLRDFFKALYLSGHLGQQAAGINGNCSPTSINRSINGMEK